MDFRHSDFGAAIPAPAPDAVPGLRKRQLRVQLLLDRNGSRGWHCLLQNLAEADGVECTAALVEGGNRLPAAAGLLFELERLVYGLAPLHLSGEAPAALFPASCGAAAAEIVLDLSGAPDARPSGARVWRLTFDGGFGEAALLGCLLAGRVPVAEVREGGTVVASARLGTEHQGITSAAFEDCLWRTITLIRQALRGGASPGAAPLSSPLRSPAAAAPPGAVLLARIAARTVARAVARRLYRLCFFSPQWRVGWRRVGGEGDLYDLRRHPPAGWTDLADDARRFYADPFPVVHEGRTFLFVEEFPHRTAKGIISAVAFGPDGPLGRPRPVLEASVHLSYPFVFERGGDMWMIPESCAAGTVDLFRATRFPGGWVREATLLSGVTASDATLVERNGRWWLFATVREGGGAFSDALHLWSAPDFRGPFTPHPANPVLIDIAAARPAGRIVERRGTLWRPVQDCSASYGGALGLARIDQLDDDGFRQTVETVLRAGSPQWPGRRLHTLNRAGSLEVIDGSGKPPRRFRCQGL